MLNLIRRHPYLLTGAAAAATTLLAALDERREGESVRERLLGGSNGNSPENDLPPRDEYGKFITAPAGGGPVVDTLLRSLGVSSAAVPAVGGAVTGLAGVARKHPALVGLGIAAAVAALGACPQVRERLNDTMGRPFGNEGRSGGGENPSALQNPVGTSEAYPRLNVAAAGMPVGGNEHDPMAMTVERERSHA